VPLYGRLIKATPVTETTDGSEYYNIKFASGGLVASEALYTEAKAQAAAFSEVALGAEQAPATADDIPF
jgi:hypothetical protein